MFNGQFDRYASNVTECRQNDSHNSRKQREMIFFLQVDPVLADAFESPAKRPMLLDFEV